MKGEFNPLSRGFVLEAIQKFCQGKARCCGAVAALNLQVKVVDKKPTVTIEAFDKKGKILLRQECESLIYVGIALRDMTQGPLEPPPRRLCSTCAHEDAGYTEETCGKCHWQKRNNWLKKPKKVKG